MQENTDVDIDYLYLAKSHAKGKEHNSWQHSEIYSVCYFDYNILQDKYRSKLLNTHTLKRYAVKPKSEIEDILNEALWNAYNQFLPDYASYEYKRVKELSQASAMIHEARNYVELKS